MAGCIFPFLLSILSCDDGMALRDYVNDYVIPATFATVEVADAAEWKGAGNTDPSGLVEKLRSLSSERGRAAITPGSEREAEEPSYTVLKITLNNERDTAYDPLFEGADAGLVRGSRSAGPSVFYITLGPVKKTGMLDIMLRLKAPPAHKPPDPVALPVECAYSSGWRGSLMVVPDGASVARGTVQQFYAVSPETGEIPVTWTLEGSRDDSSIGENGLLKVAAEETAESLTVKASAPDFPTRTAEVTVINEQVTVQADGIGADEGEGFIVERGGTIQCTASSVVGYSWIWSVDPDGASTITGDGNLTVGMDEEAMMLTVTAVSRENPQISKTVTVKIPTVTGVTVEPDAASVDRGGSRSFSAVVTGFALDDTKGNVTWTLEGSRDDSSIGENGLLKVAAEERAASLTVKAKSVYDDSKFGTASVTVEGIAERNGVRYGSIQAAIDAAQDTDVSSPAVITLLKPDITIDEAVTINNKHVKLVPDASTVTLMRGTGFTGDDLFTVMSGGSLTLEGNGSRELVLNGNKGAVTASGSLIKVFSGELTMNVGVTLKNNNRDGGSGGGVFVNGAGSFMMTGGTIGGNAAGDRGGGVFVTDGGSTFTMTGGTISGNTAGGSGGGVYVMDGSAFNMSNGAIISVNTAGGSGGGVFVTNDGSAFNMSNGAIIRGNTAGGSGGGVFVTNDGGTFTMAGGTISGNTAGGSGGGVYVDSGGVFAMAGGTISNNSAGETYAGGGGVFVTKDGAFTMAGGTISGNTAECGGGVNVWGDGSRFTMIRGQIINNESLGAGGGGVYFNMGTFTMSGGTISGNTANNGGAGGGMLLDGGTFTMSGSAVVSQNNDVYLYDGMVIAVGALSGSGPVAKITPATSPEADLQVLAGVDSATISRFTLSENVTGKVIILYGGNGFLSSAVASRTVGGSPAYYPLIQAAVDASNGASSSDPDTITVLRNHDISATISLASGKHVKLVPAYPANDNEIKLTRASNFAHSLFAVNSGASLALEGSNDNELVIDGGAVWNDPTAPGRREVLVKASGPSATGPLIKVMSGTLTINSGAVLQNNYNGNTTDDLTGTDKGGGVAVQSGVFTLAGGTIKSNYAYSDGGGVFIRNTSFTMTGGLISNNYMNNKWGNGGGIWSQDCTILFSGGEISGNYADYTYTFYDYEGRTGGGISLSGGSLTMSGTAEIKNNYSYDGGGVSVISGGEFIMNGGTISGNTASSFGGGVLVGFPKSTKTSDKGSFTMNGGTISGNTASGGGGVYVTVSTSTFIKTGGTVYGSSGVNANTANQGAALYKNSGTVTVNGNAQPTTNNDF